MVLLTVKVPGGQFSSQVKACTPVRDAAAALTAAHSLWQHVVQVKQHVVGLLEEGGYLEGEGRSALLAAQQGAADLLQATAERGLVLTVAALEGALDRYRESLLVCFPAGLPEDSALRGLLGGSQGPPTGGLDPDTAELWFAGKLLDPAGKLSDTVGSNDKTRMVVHLQPAGSMAPPREPPVDEATQKAMMAYYYRKQEERQRLDEDLGLDHHHSAWADPRSLKQHLSGVGPCVQIR